MKPMRYLCFVAAVMAAAAFLALPAQAQEPIADAGRSPVQPLLDQPKDDQLRIDRFDWLAVGPTATPPTDAAAAATSPAEAEGEEGGNSNAALAKKLSNPISNLISVPFQFNYDNGYGPKDAGRFQLNIQPVIPLSITEDWNVIIRTILPVINMESPASGVSSEFGLGDTVQSFFFSPSKAVNGITWGVGPVFLWPTATDDQLGSKKWGAGPTAVILRQDKGWTYGMLANHIWSYADVGDEDRERVSATFLQPFITHTWPTATTLGFNTESTYDWNGKQWLVPLNLFVSQVVKIGPQRVSLQLGGRYYAVSPAGGPEWGVRFTFTLLFPK